MSNINSSGGTVWLDKKGAMAYIGISKRGLEYRMADGSIRYYQLKGKILFDRDELDEDIKGKNKKP